MAWDQSRRHSWLHNIGRCDVAAEQQLCGALHAETRSKQGDYASPPRERRTCRKSTMPKLTSTCSSPGAWSRLAPQTAMPRSERDCACTQPHGVSHAQLGYLSGSQKCAAGWHGLVCLRPQGPAWQLSGVQHTGTHGADLVRL